MPPNTNRLPADFNQRLLAHPRLREIRDAFFALRAQQIVARTQGDEVRADALTVELAALRAEEIQIKDKELGPQPVVHRLNVSLSPAAVDTIENLKFAVQLTGQSVSTSALIEAALLHLEEHAGSNARLLLETIETHVGAGGARRRSGTK